MGLAVPVMDCSRIRDELGWAPRKPRATALLELLRRHARLGGRRDAAAATRARRAASAPASSPRAGRRRGGSVLGHTRLDQQRPDLLLALDLDAELLGLGDLRRADVGARDQQVGGGRDGRGRRGARALAQPLERRAAGPSPRARVGDRAARRWRRVWRRRGRAAKRLPGEARFVAAACGALAAWRERPARVVVDENEVIEESDQSASRR